jgi:hypothetical protein
MLGAHKYGRARCLLFLVAAVALIVVGVAIYEVTATIYDGYLVIDKAQESEKIFSNSVQEVSSNLEMEVDKSSAV